MNNSSKKRARTIVGAVGSFDVLHLGHVRYLEYAASFGSYLKVILSSDQHVQQRKGFVFHDQQTRKEMLEALRVVSEVVIGSDQDVFEIFDQTEIDVLVVGHDELLSLELIEQRLKEHGHPSIKVYQAPFFEGNFFKKKRYVDAYLEHQPLIEISPDVVERMTG